MSGIKMAQNLLSLPILICNAFNKIFSSPFAAWAMKQITPSGSLREQMGFFIFIGGCSNGQQTNL